MMFSQCVFVPAVAAEPAQPAEPAEPVQAMQPAEPVQAMQPAEPVQAMQPAEPVQAKQPAEPVKKRVGKGRKVKTAAKIALKKKNAPKKAVKPRQSHRKHRLLNAHFRFRQFVCSLVKFSATRNLCNSRTVASAQRAIARLSKTLHENKV